MGELVLAITLVTDRKNFFKRKAIRVEYENAK